MGGAIEPAPTSRVARRRHPMARYILRRILAGIATVVVASMLIFVAVQALPGDVASVILGKNATPTRLAEVRSQLGLDEPLPERYVNWIGGVVHGDFGTTAASAAQGGEPMSVWSSIKTPLLNSLVIAAIALLILIPLSLALGTWAAIRATKPSDHVISVSALTFSSMPEFLVGTLLVVVFFSQLALLPPISQIPPGSTPFTNPEILILPILTLLLVNLAFTTRLVRAATVDVLRQDYVVMARLNGFRERRVIWRYALRNALAPSVQAIAQTAQYLVGGIIIVESVFSYPGIGSKLVEAVSIRDVTVVAAIALILATLYVTINIVADVIVMLLLPKLRTQS